MNVKEKDLKIICNLRKDGRMQLTKMSRKTKIPVSTIYDRLKSNEYITKNTCLLDFKKLGFDIRSYMLIKVNPNQKKDLHEFLAKNWSVNSLYRINNGYDLMAECIFKELREIEEFKDLISSRFNIEEVKLFYVVDEIQKENFLADKVMIKWEN